MLRLARDAEGDDGEEAVEGRRRDGEQLDHACLQEHGKLPFDCTVRGGK